MRRPDWKDFAFAALIITVGISPVLTVPGWQGYGPHGEFAFNGGHYYVRYSDPTLGGDKPHVFALYQGFQVDMIEVSDDQSTVDGLNLFSNFTTSQNLVGGDLHVNYTSPALNFTKSVSVASGFVRVDYAFHRNVTADLTFWRWYYTSVGPFDRPVTRELPLSASIPFSFFGQGALFNGTISSAPYPVSAEISGVEGAGLNKISLQFNGTGVALTLALTSVRPLAGAGVVEVASSNWAFPVIGLFAASAYLVTRSYMKEKE